MKIFTLICLGLALSLSGCGKKSPAPQNEATLDELNRVVATMATHGGGRMPETNQIASFLALQGKTFPVPPTGKKLVINHATGKFELADQ